MTTYEAKKIILMLVENDCNDPSDYAEVMDMIDEVSPLCKEADDD